MVARGDRALCVGYLGCDAGVCRMLYLILGLLLMLVYICWLLLWPARLVGMGVDGEFAQFVARRR